MSDHDVEMQPVPVLIMGERNETTTVADRWIPRTHAIPGDGNVYQIAAFNKNRTMITMFTDSGNASVVKLSSTANGNPNISIAAGSPQIRMEHCAAIYASATSPALIYVFEESRND